MKYPKYFIKFIDYGIGDGELLCKSCDDEEDLLKSANNLITEYIKFKDNPMSTYYSDKLDVVASSVDMQQLIKNVDTLETITILTKYDGDCIDYDRRLYLTVQTLDKLLEIANEEIEKEMKKYGYINDSDNAYRFIDDLIEEDLIGCKISDNDYSFNELDTIIHNEILKKKYKHISEFELDGTAIIYYYINDLNFESVDDLKKHFGIV